MTLQLAAVLGLLGAAIVMFAMNRPRMDAVALIVLTLLPFTGAVTMAEALRGFADPNIVLIAALFVIGEGLVRTGVARRMGDWVVRTTGNSETKLLVLLMLCVCGLGAFMSSTAVTAIFIPVALRIARSTGTAAGRLMMPISFAALISGMMTLVATAPNLVVNAELERTPGAGSFQFFSFTPFGVPILILGILYMLVARRWLPAESAEDGANRRRPRLADWVARYGLVDRELRLRVLPGSSLVGRTLGETAFRSESGATVLAIERMSGRDEELVQPSPKETLRANDTIFVDLKADTTPEERDAMMSRFGLERLPLDGTFFADRAQDLGMAEFIVPAESALVGKTIIESGFRTRTGVTAIGLQRGAEAVRGPVSDEKLRIGDTLLVVGPWKRIRRLEPDDAGVLLLRLPTEFDDVLPAPRKAVAAVVCLAITVGLMITGWVPNVHAALIGCMLMGAFGCIDLPSAYRSISWKTLILIIGMLPFSVALQRTGGIEMAANGVMGAIGGADPRIVLAVIFAATAILGMFISNTATAVLMAPIAIAVAQELGLSPLPFAMTTAIAASTAFVTPVSSPVNTLVVTPGNYTFGDFVKVGGPFAIVVLVVTVLLVPLFLPF